MRPEHTRPAYHFDNSLIANNFQYKGYFTNQDLLIPTKQNDLAETGIRKSGKVRLVEVKTDGLPHNYLNLSNESDGKDIPAGIFMSAQNKLKVTYINI